MWLVEGFTRNNGWQFFVPRVVLNELERKGLDNEFKHLLENDIILGDSCTDDQLLSIEQRLPQLDCGELEAICIINKCSDKTFKPYVILTDDSLAQKKATTMGISSIDVVAFLCHALRLDLLSCECTLNAIAVLQNSAYGIESGILDQIKRMCRDKLPTVL